MLVTYARKGTRGRERRKGSIPRVRYTHNEKFERENEGRVGVGTILGKNRGRKGKGEEEERCMARWQFGHDGFGPHYGLRGRGNHDDSKFGVGHHLVTASPAAKKSWHARRP